MPVPGRLRVGARCQLGAPASRACLLQHMNEYFEHSIVWNVREPPGAQPRAAGRLRRPGNTCFLCARALLAPSTCTSTRFLTELNSILYVCHTTVASSACSATDGCALPASRGSAGDDKGASRRSKPRQAHSGANSAQHASRRALSMPGNVGCMFPPCLACLRRVWHCDCGH